MQHDTGNHKALKSIMSLISISKKANCLVSGEYAVLKAIAERKAKLVIVADNASTPTKKKFADKTNYRNIPMLVLGSKEELGSALGHAMRADIAITDEGLAKAILEKHALCEG